jgi:hypothetical protein
MKCSICDTDPAMEKHHVDPLEKNKSELVSCCFDCGDQIHMLFNNKELSRMTIKELLEKEEMKKYIKWKKKHPGVHVHRMSNEVKKWKKGHR